MQRPVLLPITGQTSHVNLSSVLHFSPHVMMPADRNECMNIHHCYRKCVSSVSKSDSILKQQANVESQRPLPSISPFKRKVSIYEDAEESETLSEDACAEVSQESRRKTELSDKRIRLNSDSSEMSSDDICLVTTYEGNPFDLFLYTLLITILFRSEIV
jgi:hypothetical protein